MMMLTTVTYYYTMNFIANMMYQIRLEGNQIYKPFIPQTEHYSYFFFKSKVFLGKKIYPIKLMAKELLS